MASPIELTSNSPIQASASLQSTHTLGNPSLDSNLRLDQIQLGKILSAQILDMLHDGTALVKININPQQSATLQMKLPDGYAVGDSLRLSLQSLGGSKPSFVLQNGQADTDSVQISATAQFLEKTLQDHPEAPRLQGNHPVVGTATAKSAQIATELNKTVENSGVFYEAHLKQWHDGQRSLEQIRQEPQNQTNPLMNDTASQLLPAQLDTLENKRFSWQGEVWPNQNMQWDISQEQDSSDHKQTSKTEPADKTWTTTLKLNLPNLGGVKASVSLQGDQVGLQFHTEKPETAVSLQTASPALLDSLSSSGSQIISFTVQKDDGA